MNIRYMIAAAVIAAAAAVPAHAQDTTVKKPGGLNKVAHDISKTAKKAGRDTKAEVHRDASKAHSTLTKAGNETKTAAGNATGIHKVGGSVGEAAKSVSHASKTTSAKLKHGVKHEASMAHDSLTKAGKKAKAKVKNP